MKKKKQKLDNSLLNNGVVMSEKELKDMIKKFIYSGPVDAAQIKNIFKTSMSRATALIKKLDVNGYFIKSTINTKQFNLSFYKEIEKLIIDELFVLKPTI